MLPKAPRLQPKIGTIWPFPSITISCLRYPSELIDTYKCTNVQMSKYLHNTIHVASCFPGSHPSPEVTLPGKSTFPGSQPSKSLFPGTLPGKSYFPGSHLSWEVKFPGKSYFPGSQIFREVKFPRKSHFPGSQISREVKFPGKSYFPGSRISREVKFTGKSNSLEVR